MKKMKCFCSCPCFKNVGLLIVRLVIGAIFIYAGYSKIFVMGMENVAGMFGEMGFPAAAFFAWLTAVAELLTGIMLVLGIWTKFAAAILMIIMLVALFVVHIQNGFDAGTQYVLSLIAALAALMSAGGGKWCVTKRCCPCPAGGCCGGEKGDCCEGGSCDKK